jgi:hypothetical protein
MIDKNGFLLLNGDDRHAGKRSRPHLGKDIVFFGFSARCQVRARNEKLTSNNKLGFEVGAAPYRIVHAGQAFYLQRAIWQYTLGSISALKRAAFVGRY